jgi:hypothetical protein
MSGVVVVRPGWSDADGPDELEALMARGPRGHLPRWPLFGLIVLYPVWWALGVTAFIYILFAIPAAMFLSRRRPLRLPPGFILWALFLVWVSVGVIMVNADAPDTLPVDNKARYLSFGLRVLGYLAVTVLMVYAGNMTERELPRLKLMRWLGALFVTTVVGGLAGTFFPYFSYTSPIARLLPSFLRNSAYVRQLLKPAVAQVQDVLGYSSPRPMAPFEYTNAWGNNFSMLLIWFVLGWCVYGTAKHRIVAVPLLLVSIIPVVYSLNRGLWIGLGISAVYVAARLAMRSKLAGLAYLLVGLALLGVLVIATPLSNLLSERLDNPHSNDIRASLSQASIHGALESPVFGWGSTRATVGSGRSISIGKSADCARCGNRVIGSTGEFWLVLFTNGFVGAGLYVGFFLYAIWRYRGDHSVLGIAGGLGVVLPLFYMFVYNALTSPLFFYLLSAAFLWRNDQIRNGIDSPVVAPGPPVRRVLSP